MSWKHWTAVITVIGSGILLQIPAHRDVASSSHEHGTAEFSAAFDVESDVAGPYRTVVLEVTGMT